jgi:hypothetical protein
MKALLLYGRKAGNQQFPQATLITILKESRKSERLAGTPTSLKMGI